MDESRVKQPKQFKFYDCMGEEVTLRRFAAGDVVVARVTKEMSKERFKEFCESNQEMAGVFQKRGIFLIFCPDWVDFKELK